MHSALVRSACLFGFQSEPCGLFEKGMDHADVVNYKAGTVHGASQHVCVSVFVHLLVRALPSVHIRDDVHFFKGSTKGRDTKPWSDLRI